jgi:hypothetical protein
MDKRWSSCSRRVCLHRYDGNRVLIWSRTGMSTKSFDIPPEQRREFTELLNNLIKLMAHLENRAPAIYQFVRNLPPMLEEWKKLVGIVSVFLLEGDSTDLSYYYRWLARNTSALCSNQASLLASCLRRRRFRACSPGLSAAPIVSSTSWARPRRSSSQTRHLARHL